MRDSDRQSEFRAGLRLSAALCLAVFVMLVVAPSRPGAEAWAQSNPVPLINQPLVPDAVAPGGQSFTLTVNGTGFVPGSVVQWNGTALATTYVSGSRLTATVPASDIAVAVTASITVANPGSPVVSNVDYFQVSTPASAISFSDSQTAVGSWPVQVMTADFNGDDKLDALVVSAPWYFGESGDGQVSVMLGNGDGTFGQPTTYTIPGFMISHAATADFNGDGKLDLVVTVLDNQGNGYASILLGNGDGTFGQPTNFVSNANSTIVATADFNADGKLDLAIVCSYGVSILLGNGDGTFQPQVTYGPEEPYTLTIGDFNSDDILDLAVGDQTSDQLHILLGNGDGTFQAPSSFGSGEPFAYFVTTADVNSDGKLDLMAGGNSGQATVLLGDGDGAFQPYVGYATGLDPLWIETSDFNADGDLDLVTANTGANTVSVLLGNGNGTFQSHMDFGTGQNPTSVATGDFNGDGKLDLISANTASNTISVLLQQGAVTLSPTTLTFPTQVLGSQSSPQTVTLTNETGSTLMIQGVNVSGSGSTDFSQTNTCGSSVPPGGSCTIAVVFRPRGEGLFSASVTIEDGAEGGGPTFSVVGTGTEAKLIPRQINFGSVPVGSKSQQTVTLTNVGRSTLEVRHIGIQGDYTDFTESNNCTRYLAPGKSCAITVTFQPQSVGERAARVEVDNDGTGLGYFFEAVGLTGAGTQ